MARAVPRPERRAKYGQGVLPLANLTPRRARPGPGTVTVTVLDSTRAQAVTVGSLSSESPRRMAAGPPTRNLKLELEAARFQCPGPGLRLGRGPKKPPRLCQ